MVRISWGYLKKVDNCGQFRCQELTTNGYFWPHLFAKLSSSWVAFGGGCIHLLQVGYKLLLVFIGHVAQGVSDLVNDAQLHLGAGKHALNGLRKSFRPIDAGNQDILHARFRSSVRMPSQKLAPSFSPIHMPKRSLWPVASMPRQV
jgi:hypothetical protein